MKALDENREAAAERLLTCDKYLLITADTQGTGFSLQVHVSNILESLGLLKAGADTLESIYEQMNDLEGDESA